MKEKTKIIISIIITFIITLSITVTANIVINATDITFSSNKTDKTNVKDSLDELYTLTSGGNDQEIIIKFVRDLEWNVKTSTGNTIAVTEGEKYVIMMTSATRGVEPTIQGATVLTGPFYRYGGNSPNISLGFAIVEATSNTITYGNRDDGQSVIASFELEQVENIRGEIPDNMGLVYDKAVPATPGKIYLIISSEVHAAGCTCNLIGGNFYNSNQNIVNYDGWVGLNFTVVRATSDSLIYKNRTEDLSQQLSYMGYVELF